MGRDVLDGIFAGEVPVGEFFCHAQLVVKDGIGTVVHGPVRPVNELVTPQAFAHVGNHKSTGIVITQRGAFAGEFVVFGELAAGIVLVGNLRTAAVPVEITFYVDEPSVEV